MEHTISQVADLVERRRDSVLLSLRFWAARENQTKLFPQYRLKLYIEQGTPKTKASSAIILSGVTASIRRFKPHKCSLPAPCHRHRRQGIAQDVREKNAAQVRSSSLRVRFDGMNDDDILDMQPWALSSPNLHTGDDARSVLVPRRGTTHIPDKPAARRVLSFLTASSVGIRSTAN